MQILVLFLDQANIDILNSEMEEDKVVLYITYWEEGGLPVYHLSFDI